MAERILSDLECHDSELSVLLVDDADIVELNLRYLSRNQPTNVLSFPMNEAAFSELQPRILGDVVISTETAVRESEQRGITVDDEMALLLVHGILHLIGYEHEDSQEDAVRMEQKEREVLERVGFLHPGWR
jgi:probable rRNA maturation factor